MTDDRPERPAILSAEELVEGAEVYRHRLDSSCEVIVSDCSRRAGLDRTGVTLARLKPGKAAFPLHRHHAEEEWVYVLEGTAEVRLGDDVRSVGPGSFVAFVPGGPAHQLRNGSDADVVYLMGGESSAVEIVDFPELEKRSFRTGDFYASTTVPLCDGD